MTKDVLVGIKQAHSKRCGGMMDVDDTYICWHVDTAVKNFERDTRMSDISDIMM